MSFRENMAFGNERIHSFVENISGLHALFSSVLTVCGQETDDRLNAGRCLIHCNDFVQVSRHFWIGITTANMIDKRCHSG